MNSCYRMVIFMIVALAALPMTARAADALQFKVERPAEGVLIFTEESPWESNHVVLVTDKGLVLVDPGGHPVIAEALREAVRKELGRSDFTYVINHHHHWGHTWANGSFPEAVVIGHEDSVALMERDAGGREATITQMRQAAERAGANLAEQAPDSDEALANRRARAHAERAVEGLGRKGFFVRPPEITFNDRMTLDLGNMTLEFAFLGRGHSETDTVIFIPQRGVLMMGCFFFMAQNLPFFGMQPELDVDRWLSVWDAILDSGEPVETVVLGQYNVWDRGKFLLMRDYIDSLWEDVQRLEAAGLDLAAAQEKLPPPESLKGLMVAGVDGNAIEQYHQRNVRTFWRQLKESAAGLVGQAIDDQGLEAGLARYKALKASKDSDCYFDENEINLLGYRYLQQEEFDKAIAVFKLNAEAYPESWNVYDSLGEAYMNSGDRQKAIELYEKSVEINPGNVNGIARLEQLRAAEQ